MPPDLSYPILSCPIYLYLNERHRKNGHDVRSKQWLELDRRVGYGSSITDGPRRARPPSNHPPPSTCCKTNETPTPWPYHAALPGNILIGPVNYMYSCYRAIFYKLRLSRAKNRRIWNRVTNSPKSKVQKLKIRKSFVFLANFEGKGLTQTKLGVRNVTGNRWSRAIASEVTQARVNSPWQLTDFSGGLR